MVLKLFQGPVRIVIGMISSLIPKKKGVIVFCSDRYNENSRYLYEYMVGESIVDVYWLSYSDEVTKHLNEREYPVLDKWWRQIWILMRASVVVCSGNIFWDRYGAVSKPTIKYCLMHGCGPKVTEYHDDFNKTIKILAQINSFDFVNFPSQFGATLGANIYKLPRKKIVCKGYPRFDQLFNANHISYIKTRSELSEYLGVSIDQNTKLVLYSPTFRKYNRDYCFPIENLTGYSSWELDCFLKKNNMYIIYTKHPQSSGAAGWQMLDNCIYLDYKQNHIFDISYFLQAFDILINDYSTVSVDFSILGRPQIFVMPDYDVYKNTDGFNEEYCDVIVGPVAQDFFDLIAILSRAVLVNEGSSSEFYIGDVKKDLRKYWSGSLNESCKLNSAFIIKLSMCSQLSMKGYLS